MGVRQSRNGYTSTPRNLPNLANFNIEGNVKVLLLGTGEGGKATIFKQMVHQYGTKRRVDQTISELEDEHFLNSYQSVEVRKSFIPIIHRNCILAMYNLVYGAINTFQLPVNMTPNTPTKEAVDIIFSEREHAISFEDWSLTARIGKTISYLWNNEPCIQEAYHRRNELELEYMESAKYWFQEIDRIVEPNYLPKMDDIFRMRVKTTGIVETDLHVPIKVRRRQEDSYNNITMDDMSSDKMLYKRASLVLMGSQRNERKKWIHAFLEASAVVFVVALSEYNQLLYEDGRTNRLKESLVLFSEIVNSSYFEGVPIYLFLNKHDVFMERIQTSDLSNVFPDLPDDLRLDSLPIKNFVPQIIQQKLTQVNEQWAQQAQSHKLMDELANYEKQRIAVLSDDEAEPQDHQQQGTNNRKKEKKKHHLSRRARLIRRLTRGKSQKHTVSGLGRKKSSLLFDRIELASRASDSSFKSVASFNDTLHDEGDDEEDEEEEDDPNSSTSSDTTTITSTTNNHTTEEFFLPDDVILYTFMFLEPKDLVEVNLVCYDFYMIAESDILWRTMCLRYQSDLQEEAVLQVYAKQSDTDSPQQQQQQQQQQPFNLIQITSPSLLSDGVMDVTKSPPDYSRIVKTGPYKHYYQFGEQFVRRNVLYITNQFLSLTPRRDIKVEVTCAIDMISFKPIMERVLAGILKEVASSSRK